MLGSFIIGLVATSAMVQIDEQKPVVILGVDHPWQSNASLQVGVRTGLCGSITTFSSWMLEAMTTCLTGNQWLTGIGQMIVGFACAVISFVIGTHMALIIHHKITKAPLENEMLNYSKREADFIFGGGEDPERVVSKELEELEPDLPMQRPLSTTETIGLNYVADIEAEHTTTSESKGVEPRAYEAQWIDHVAALSLVLFTIGASFGVAYETEHRWIRNIWLSILFAPFGCISRWILSKANYRIKYGWDWLPAGTLAANWTGVILDYVLQSIQIRVAPGYWGSLVIDAVETGFCGCLTTVSTLIAEIMKLSELLPFSLRAYVYTTMTFVGACILGICLLGWVYWT
jgi:fluoride exporter